jgi:transposase InsO family protein
MIVASHSPINTVMTKHPGQLLHMDTVGPSRVRSMGGKWYVLVIVDNYSRYSLIFFLVSKDEVFEHFQLLALRLNNEHPNCLKVIRSDNGTEFRNTSFDEFCLEHGIDQQFSTPRVPQQNGVVERKNRTLVEMVRTMLDEHRTPRRFWTDAISIACYISNRIFLCSILHLTPFELRFGRIHPPPLVAFSGPSFSPPFFAAKAEQVAATAHRRLATDSTRHQRFLPPKESP